MGSGGAARGWGGAVGAFGGEKPGEGAVGGEGGEGDATRPNPGGRSAMEGDSVEVGEAGKVVEARVGEELAAGPRCAMLTIERDGSRRPVRYGKRNPLGRWRERLSANRASMRCSCQSCVTDSSV